MSVEQANQGYFMDESTVNTIKLIPAGITENVKITDIAFEPLKQDGSGILVLRFKFEDAQGNTFTHTEFPVDPEQVKKNSQSWNRPYDELLSEAFRTLGSKVQHILMSFVPADKCKVYGKTWEEFAKKAIEIAGKAYEGQLFRIKLILNNKDYTSFPRTAIAPFIQNMSIKPGTLVINPKYDRIIPATPDTSGEAEAADAFGAPAAETGDSANIPAF